MTLHGNSCQSSLQKIQLRSAKYVHYDCADCLGTGTTPTTGRQQSPRFWLKHQVNGSITVQLSDEHNRLILPLLPPGFCLTRSLFCQAEVPSTIHGELRGGELPFGGVAGCKGILSTRHSQQLCIILIRSCFFIGTRQVPSTTPVELFEILVGFCWCGCRLSQDRQE